MHEILVQSLNEIKGYLFQSAAKKSVESRDVDFFGSTSSKLFEWDEAGLS